MMDDLKIYERLSDLLYKDLLGMTSKEEKQELDSLCEEYGVKEMDRDKIVARLQGTDDFDGREAYRKFKILKKNARKTFRIGWWVSTAVSIVVLCIIGWWMNNKPEQINKVEPVVAEVICPGQSCAVITLADGKQVSLEENIQELEESDGTILRSESGTLVYKANLYNETAEVMYNTVTIPRGGEYCLELADGTKVWLNAETELRFPVNFSDKTRDVYLKGEAYFEVSKNKEKPFLVQVDDMSVKVYGTEFNVNTYNKIETVLVTGSVGMNQGGKEVLLKPNQKGVFDQVSGKITVADVDVLAYVSWKNGDFIFRNESLNSIMDKLSRWYGLEVLYQDAGLQDVRLSGNLKRYKDVRELFVSFEKISDARFKVQGNKVIVSSK